MSEIKVVAIKDGEIINIGKFERYVPPVLLDAVYDEETGEIIEEAKEVEGYWEEYAPDGVTYEEREMEYTEEYGWREANWQRPLTDAERIAQLEEQNHALNETLDSLLLDVIPAMLLGE